MTRWSLVARQLTAVVVLLAAAAGCGGGGQDNDAATSTSPPARSTIVTVAPPEAKLANDPIVAAVRPSVVKVSGQSQRCTRGGSGFVVAPNRVMSTADTVAGTDSITVEVDGTSYAAKAVSYDPRADVAFLDVPNLTAPPLAFAESTANIGEDALILGYPDAQTFAATPARIDEIISLVGRDIYGEQNVTRLVYTIRGPVQLGSSGSPLIDLHGRVLGMVFSRSVDDPEAAFALTVREITPQMTNAGNTAPVVTGACIG